MADAVESCENLVKKINTRRVRETVTLYEIATAISRATEVAQKLGRSRPAVATARAPARGRGGSAHEVLRGTTAGGEGACRRSKRMN